jgi:hypothetical protein
MGGVSCDDEAGFYEAGWNGASWRVAPLSNKLIAISGWAKLVCMHDRTPSPFRLTDADRIDRLRLIRSDNVGPRGIMAQTPQAI